jgi:hypothetical protein
MSLEPYERSRGRFQPRQDAQQSSADSSSGTPDRHNQLFNAVASLWRILVATPIASVAAVLPGAKRSNGLTGKVDQVVDRHAAALVALRAAAFRHGTDDFGHSRWDHEVARFINSEVTEMLDAGELAALGRHFKEIHSRVAQRVGEIAADQWAYH